MVIQALRALDPNGADGCDIGVQLNKDNQDRLSFAYNTLPSFLFPDSAFGFTVDAAFVRNFNHIILDSRRTIKEDNFSSEDQTANFLNRMITTVSCCLHALGQTHIKPLRYFTARQKNTPIINFLNRKPDIAAVRLVGEYPQQEKLEWSASGKPEIAYFLLNLS